MDFIFPVQNAWIPSSKNPFLHQYNGGSVDMRVSEWISRSLSVYKSRWVNMMISKLKSINQSDQVRIECVLYQLVLDAP